MAPPFGPRRPAGPMATRRLASFGPDLSSSPRPFDSAPHPSRLAPAGGQRAAMEGVWAGRADRRFSARLRERLTAFVFRLRVWLMRPIFAHARSEPKRWSRPRAGTEAGAAAAQQVLDGRAIAQPIHERAAATWWAGRRPGSTSIAGGPRLDHRRRVVDPGGRSALPAYTRVLCSHFPLIRVGPFWRPRLRPLIFCYTAPRCVLVRFQR